MKKVLLGIALSIVSGVAIAGTAGQLTLVRVTSGSTGGSSNAVSISGASYYHNADGSISQLAASTTVAFDITPLPGNELFSHAWSGMELDGAGGLSVTAYSCIEGTFGTVVRASLCTNANWGANFINESTTNYNTVPGTRVIGGDDQALGPQQQATDYACIISQNDAFISGTVLCNTTAWDSASSPGLGGYQLEFHHTTVPVPAAAWLFGSGLGLLGWVRRRAG